MSLPGLGVHFDIPLYPGVYATAGLTITPRLNITLSSGTVGLKTNILSISNVGITGEMGLDITADVGVGAGLANIAGLEAGAFVGLGGTANLSGMLGGEVNFKDNTSTVKLDLNGSAAITGEVGVFGRAKLLKAVLEKKITIANREFASYEYTRKGEYSNGWSYFMPKVADFNPKYDKKKGPFNLEINDETTGLA
jgi:hypothetical protein